ncbi:MAG: LemA family protein [Flavobacteriales bacterium]
MKNILIGLGGIILLVVMFYLWAGKVYDGAVAKQETVSQKWADVQSDYQRRADLIPNLVATVKGAAENEKNILTEVTNARAGISKATTPAEIDQHAATLNRAISIVFENYPEIRATENFGMLQSQLEGTENRIKKSRSDYNEAVKEYNSHIRGIWRTKALGMLGSLEDFPQKHHLKHKLEARTLLRLALNNSEYFESNRYYY